MKTLMCSLATTIGLLASAATAERVVTIDGEDFLLSHLTQNCQNIKDDPAAQIACFNELSQYLEEKPAESQVTDAAVTEALEALRTVAQYQDKESGLLIAGSSCNIRIDYYTNYFHISRRNISSIDLYSAEFDASKIQQDKTVRSQNPPLLIGNMDNGENATMRGGAALESSQYNFPPRSPAASLDAYASEVVAHLPTTENQEFQFVLFHPQRNDAGSEIWGAFTAFAEVCRARHTPSGPKIN